MDEALARQVRQRANGLCEYCQMPQEYDRPLFEIEHIIARQHAGKTILSNLALACFTCNHHKGPNLSGIDPQTRKITPLFHPRRHMWHRHFRWEGPILVGRTAIGRTTLAVLAINLPIRVRLRQELIEEDLFPPS